MKPDKLDQILSSEEELLPSSGFLASVMERVQEEALAPPPIPFPWKRALPGVILSVGVLLWVGIELIRYFSQIQWAVPAAAAGTTLHRTPYVDDIAWVGLAFGVSLISWLLSRRMAGRSGLI